MGTGGRVYPLLKPKVQAPPLGGLLCSNPPTPVREKNFQVFFQILLKMAEKSFKMSKILLTPKSSFFEPFLTTFKALSPPSPSYGAQSSPPLELKSISPFCQPNSYPLLQPTTVPKYAYGPVSMSMTMVFNSIFSVPFRTRTAFLPSASAPSSAICQCVPSSSMSSGRRWTWRTRTDAPRCWQQRRRGS